MNYTASMQLFPNTFPNNRWYWLRHGQSMANVLQIIASDPDTAVENFGLSAHGEQQVQLTMSAAGELDSSTRVIASDFKRARQTAEIAHGCLQCDIPVHIDTRLRERYFGLWEATSIDNYNAVWASDATDPHLAENNVESVASVAKRMCALITSLDRQYEHQDFLLVSHGDPLQILECCFTGRPLTEHRLLPPLDTAELRSCQQTRVG